jgi:hypothetical protein
MLKKKSLLKEFQGLFNLNERTVEETVVEVTKNRGELLKELIGIMEDNMAEEKQVIKKEMQC